MLASRTETTCALDVFIPNPGARRWHAEIIRRLRATGYDVRAVSGRPEASSPLFDSVLGADARIFRVQNGLWARTSLELVSERRSSAMALDLAGHAPPGAAPVLTLSFGDGPHLTDLAARIAAGHLPDLAMLLDGDVVAGGHPMIDNRVSIARGLEDVLATAITLIETTLKHVLQGQLPDLPDPVVQLERHGSFLSAYVTRALPRLGREWLRRRRYRPAHWRVGYRLIDGVGVAETGNLSGAPWSILPDDGSRFYADPFPFEHEEARFIFVEDFAHSTGKGVISVSALDAAGRADPPMPVLEEAYHLSYPQVFARDGAIWMLPESSAGENLVLYKAERFPDVWRRHTVLIEGRSLSDATLLEQDGVVFLFATDRDGGGSTSDRLVVYCAEHLEGPYRPHPDNPILIDRRRARPGGAFVKHEGRLLLPVQDGTLGYGGGLGLSEVRVLTPEHIAIDRPVPISTKGFWPYPQIHTLNRAGRLEVIDGIAAVRKRPQASSAS